MRRVVLISLMLVIVPRALLGFGGAQGGVPAPVPAPPGGGAVPAPVVPVAAPALPPISAPAAVLGGPAVIGLQAAMQQAVAKPMDATARADLSRAGANAMTANRLIDQAAASGKYDTSDYEKVKMALALQVMSQQLGNGASKQESASSKPRQSRENRMPARDTSSGDQPSAQAVGAPQIQLFAPLNDVRVSLRFDNPAVTPQQSADFARQKVQSEINAMSLAGLSGASLGTQPSSFVASFVTALRRQESETPNSNQTKGAAEVETKQSAKGSEENVRIDEKGPTSASNSSVKNDANGGEDLTPEEKKLLTEIVRKSLEVTGERANKTDLTKLGDGPEKDEAEFASALKGASRDNSVFESLVDDISLAIQSQVKSDPKARRSLRSLLEKEKRRWDVAGSPVDVSRATASDSFGTASWFSSFESKNLILLGLGALILVGLFTEDSAWLARRRTGAKR